jgi:hypothetical protein
MRPGHHDYVRGAGAGHDLGLEIAAVHRFQIGYDGRLGKSRSEFADPMHAFGNDQRRADFQPIDPAAHRQFGGR